MKRFFVLTVSSFLLFFVFACVSDGEGEGNEGEKCTSNYDCPLGQYCNLETGLCSGDTGDTGDTGLPGDSGDTGNSGNSECNNNGNMEEGVCVCNSGYAGQFCEKCASGYTGYPDCKEDKGSCEGVDCNGNGQCLESIGKCSCYTGFGGEFCDQCEEGYTGYPDCKLELCTPGDRGCKGNIIVECNSDGTDFFDVEECTGDGVQCYKGKCLDECGIVEEEQSYVGCEYWGAFLQQGGGYEANATYALVVANPNDSPAEVSIYTSGDNLVTQGTVPAKGLHSFELGKGNRVMSPGISDLGFKLKSSKPVTVTQMNPFGNVLMYSNDATLLLPLGALGNDYYVMSWPSWSSLSGFISIVAVEDGTTSVTVTYTSTTKAGGGINAENPGATVSYSLNKYQILTLNATNGGSDSYGGDLTGSLVKTDKKVAVFGGHICTRIPANKTACDHMEHQMFPLQSWGKNFSVSRTKPRSNEEDYYRILASEDGTEVIWTGGTSGSVMLNAGQFIPFSTREDFIVSATKPVLVGQFLASQNAGAGTGDPAMMLIAPDEQLRNDYIFLVPPNYDYNRITIVADADTEITVNDTSYFSNSFVNIPGTEKYKLWVDMTAGAHTLVSTKPVGLYVYGFSAYVSYAYTAGLDLTTINPQY
jgi:hypothetical protein